MTTGPGFIERQSLIDAWKWLDAFRNVTGSESVPSDQAFGRVLSAPLAFPAERPDRDIALVDGYAVRAESTLGASSYNPLPLAIVPKGDPVAAGCASICCSGETLPQGADAVLPREASEVVGTILEVCDAVAHGAGVGRKGEAAQRNDVAIEAGRRLDAPQIALAASLGATHLPVRCCPRVALLVAGPKPNATEAIGLALVALVRRDGGMAHPVHCEGDVARTLSRVAPADLVLLVGRSGWGEDDDAIPAIAAAGGRIDHHGIALIPGGSAGLGWFGEAPLLLLPGDPLSALVTYELLAGRLLRRLAGRPSEWPYGVRRLTLSRKIVSPIGVSEWVPVVCRGPCAEPLAVPPADGLTCYAKADGFLLVPASLEGFAPRTRVEVVMSESAGREE